MTGSPCVELAVVAYAPAPQGEQMVAPAVVEASPKAQGEQSLGLVEPSTAEAVPGAHCFLSPGQSMHVKPVLM